MVLSDVRVLDLSRLYPGPFCSMILSDFGAEVIRIEDRRYEEEGLGWDTIMRNKKHMTLNLKQSEGREAFYRLVKTSDVVIEGFRPGVAARLGIDYPALKQINKGIIYCSISGYGQDGPYETVAGHDINYISFSGILYHCRQKGQKPTLPSVQIADAASGGLYATIGILLAILSRKQTGKGQFIDISMLDGLVSMTQFLFDFMNTKGKMPSYDNCHTLGAYACYNVYETKDEKYITLGAVEPRFWEKICQKFGKEDFIPYQYDDVKQTGILKYFNDKFLEKTREEWWEELKEMDICFGKVLNIEEVMHDPQVKFRNMIQTIEHPEKGEVKVLGQSIKMSESRARPPSSPAIRFGEHTEEILNTLGFSREDIGRFKEEKII